MAAAASQSPKANQVPLLSGLAAVPELEEAPQPGAPMAEEHTEYVSCRETLTPFLEARPWERSASPRHGARHASRSREPWSSKAELLLYNWSSSWDAKAEAHGAAERSKRFGHLLLQIPTVIIPIVLAPVLAARFLEETSPFVVGALVLCALTGALQPVLQMERKSEQHSQAAFRYADLLTDAEEILAQERCFRAPVDVTVQKFKMRMDAAERYSPPVSIDRSPATGETCGAARDESFSESGGA